MRPHAVLVAAAIAGALLAASPALAGGTASAVLKDASGNEVGRATLTSTPSGALLNLTLTAAPPGVHALHIHAVGKCEPPKFESAGPHFNPDQTKHGIMNPEGPHAGDLPNLHVPADGKLEVEFLDPVVTLSAGSGAARRRRRLHRHSCRRRRLHDRPRRQRRRPHRLRRHHLALEGGRSGKLHASPCKGEVGPHCEPGGGHRATAFDPLPGPPPFRGREFASIAPAPPLAL